MRTYRREDYLAAQKAWEDFGPAWHDVRGEAAARGMLYPPAGSKWDSWEDAEPSQRAIVYRAIEDTPQALTDAIRQSRNWFEVVRKLMADLERRREDADLAELQDEWDRQDEPNRRQALESIHSLLTKVRDS